MSEKLVKETHLGTREDNLSLGSTWSVDRSGRDSLGSIWSVDRWGRKGGRNPSMVRTKTVEVSRYRMKSLVSRNIGVGSVFFSS